MRQRAYFFVNGINTFPGHSRNWNGRAVTWINTRTEAKAEKLEYLCGPIGRMFGQKDRARKLYRTLSFYEKFSNVVVGHSNGADVILDMLNDFVDWPEIRHVHLVCPACDADFEANGLNRLMSNGRILRVWVYVAGLDKALRMAHTIPGKMLGYGTLGLTGPQRVPRHLKDRVRVINWPDFGHSDCWSDPAFESTMAGFTTD